MLNDPAERETPLRAVKVNAICPSCREGDLIMVDVPAQLTYPPQVPHECNACGYKTTILGRVYPYMDFRMLD